MLYHFDYFICYSKNYAITNTSFYQTLETITIFLFIILLILTFGKVPTREKNKKCYITLIILFIIQILMLLQTLHSIRHTNLLKYYYLFENF